MQLPLQPRPNGVLRMNADNYPETMTTTGVEQHPKRPARRDRSGWLWSVASVTAVFGAMDLRRGESVIVATLPGLIFAAAFVGVVALVAAHDRRGRVAAAFAPLPVLAVGFPAIRLLSPGWALTAIVAALAATAAIFGSRTRRRTKPDTAASESAEPVPSKPDTSSGVEQRRPTPEQNRAATEARWAEGVERDRRQRAEREAEYERAAEQRRSEGAARREAEAGAGR